MKKLYVVVASALAAGLKMAQACHGMRQFIEEHPDIDRQWFTESNNIVVLQVDDVPSLADLLEDHGVRLSRFHEPDLGGQLTAICVEPTQSAKTHLQKIQLAS